MCGDAPGESKQHRLCLASLPSDVWTVVARHLDVASQLALAGTCTPMRRLVLEHQCALARSLGEAKEQLSEGRGEDVGATKSAAAPTAAAQVLPTDGETGEEEREAADQVLVLVDQPNDWNAFHDKFPALAGRIHLNLSLKNVRREGGGQLWWFRLLHRGSNLSP